MEGDADTVRNRVMSALMLDKLQIIEIYNEKPDLEEIFLNYVNKNTERSSLQDIVDELEADQNSSADSSNDSDSENNKEEE